MFRVTAHTVQARWCAEGKIECEQPGGKGTEYLIPRHKAMRLQRRGKRPK